jgi:hypothetical protein
LAEAKLPIAFLCQAPRQERGESIHCSQPIPQFGISEKTQYVLKGTDIDIHTLLE